MSVLLRIAARNLLEHKGKTLIIGIIVALGVIVLIVGNSLMDTATRGIRRAFIDNYTGDVMISGVADGRISLFGVQTVGGIDPTPTIPEFDRIAAHVAELPGVVQQTPQITGFGLIRPEIAEIDGLENSELTVLFGIDPESYHQVFDNARLIAGTYLTPGQEGIMITADRITEMEETIVEALEEAETPNPEFSISVGDQIRLVSGLQGGLPRIRVVPLVGIYENTGISEGVGAELVSYIDAQTLRAISGLNLGTNTAIDLAPEQTELLDIEVADEQAFFGNDSFADSLFSDQVIEDTSDEEFDFDSIDSLIAPSASREETDARAVQASIGSTWNYILVRVDTARRTDEVVKQLNQWFDDEAIAAQAGNWEVAAGPFATTADVIRTVFNIAIIVIGVVAVIIMMNTMVISVMERTSEIGTMRALGAQKSVVWRMFMAETLAITTVFGLMGVALALATIGVLHVIGIPATNTFLTVLFAGPELKPVARAGSVLLSLALVSVVGLLAHIYPVLVAMKIPPIRAIQTE